MLKQRISILNLLILHRAKALLENQKPAERWEFALEAKPLELKEAVQIEKKDLKILSNAGNDTGKKLRIDFSKFADKTQVKRETPKVTVSMSPLFRWTIVIVVSFIIILVMIVIYLIMNAETTDDSDVEATSLLHDNHIHKY